MQKILVVGPSWVGDMVMAQSLFMALRQRYPDAVIDVLSPAWSGPVLSRMPEVRQHIDMPVGHGEIGLGVRYRLGKQLRAEQYDWSIVIPSSLKSALVPFFASIPKRTGFRGEMRYGLLTDVRDLDKTVLTLSVQRYLALSLDPGSPLPPTNIPQPKLKVDPARQRVLVDRIGLDLDRPAVAFVPGAEYGPAKRWPPKYFAELGRELVEQGLQVWLFGSAKDQEVCQEIAAGIGEGVVNLAGKTQLEDVVDLIALTELVVTNDSGLMHIAAATGRSLVVIYGSSTPDYTPPLTDNAEIVYLQMECSPCFKRECPKGHYQCLKDIAVADVIARCKEKLSQD